MKKNETIKLLKTFRGIMGLFLVISFTTYVFYFNTNFSKLFLALLSAMWLWDNILMHINNDLR